MLQPPSLFLFVILLYYISGENKRTALIFNILNNQIVFHSKQIIALKAFET